MALGKFPVSLLDTPAEFSPIDSTAEAIVKIAGARGDFSVFHAYSSYVIQMADVVEHLYRRDYHGKMVIDDAIKTAIDAYYEQYGVK